MNPKPTYEELAHCVQALEKEVERHKRLEGALNLRKRQFSDSQKLAHVGSWTWEISMGEVY